MRFHLLGLPHVQSTMAYELDGFSTMTIRFARVLKTLGHTVYLYASEENEAPCDELIPCTTKAEQVELLSGAPYQACNYARENPLFQRFNHNAANAIHDRKRPHDVITCITGHAQQPVSETHADLPWLEYSIGYSGVAAPYRVYQSHAWRHTVAGFTGFDSGRFFDAVIPPFFEKEDFQPQDPEDYFLYCGRIVNRKGVKIAVQAAQVARVPLKIIGHGDPALIASLPEGMYCGTPVYAERNEMMAKARALFAPTEYVEPFGCVVAEAQLCGTPVISTDFGAFTESVEQGKSGYRCNLLGEFAAACRRIDSIDRNYVRERAQRLYSMESAAESYKAYFTRLRHNIGDDSGWESLDPGPVGFGTAHELTH